MDKRTATAVNHILVSCYADLHRSIDLAKCSYNDQRFGTYCRAAGGVLGHMLLELMDPIYEEYPELAPEPLRRLEDDNSEPGISLSCNESTSFEAGDVCMEATEGTLPGLLAHVIEELGRAWQLLNTGTDDVNEKHRIQEIQHALRRVIELKSTTEDEQSAMCSKGKLGCSSDHE